MARSAEVKSYKMFVVLGLLIFVGLQLATINKWSIWHDESFTAMLLEYNFSDMLSRAAADVHPPLYYIVLKGWAAFFGDSLLALRLFSVTCMSAAFVVVAILLKKSFGYRTATKILPFFVLAPMLVRYGQEMRMYGLASLLVAASTYAFLAARESSQARQKWLWAFAYGLLLAACIYTHYFAILIAVAHFGLLVRAEVVGRKPGKRVTISALWNKYSWFVAAGLLAIGLFVPWIPTLLSQVKATTNAFWIGPVGTHSLVSSLSEFVFFHPQWANWNVDGWYSVGVLTVLVVLAVGTLRAIRQKKAADQEVVINWLWLWLLPMIALFLLSMPPATSYYYNRYLAPFAGFFYVTLGIATLFVSTKPLFRRATYSLMIIFLLGGVYSAQTYGNNYGHTPDSYFMMRPAAERIINNFRMGDTVVVDDLWVYFDARYYLRQEGIETYLHAVDEPRNAGNQSLVYRRDDLFIRDFKQLNTNKARRAWHIRVAGSGKELDLPPTWQHVETYRYGYAEVGLYIVD